MYNSNFQLFFSTWPGRQHTEAMSLTPLDEDQFAHFEEAWRLFDTDGDGLVTPKDLQALLRSFGYEHSLVIIPAPSLPNTSGGGWRGGLTGGLQRCSRSGCRSIASVHCAPDALLVPRSRKSWRCTWMTCRSA